MPEFQITKKLLDIPLFQGLSTSDLHEIIGHTKFDFRKHEPGQTIARAGERCLGIIFLLSGDMTAITSSTDNLFTVTEQLGAPMTIQPERMFGRDQAYTSTFKAQTPCSTLWLNKKEVATLQRNYEVIHINLTNHYATAIQRQWQRQWTAADPTLRARILDFLTTHTTTPEGPKRFSLTMATLAKILNDSRLNISKQLNTMQREGLLTLARSTIVVPAIERLTP